MNKKDIDEGLDNVADDIAAAAVKVQRKARQSLGKARAGASEIAEELQEPMRAMGAFMRQRPLETAAIALAGAWLARWLLGRLQHD